ncbi:MAG: hypothetical protein IJJ70_06405 [Treponema sp.]|nr:hypothetical protein [Treponema sp.]
MKKFILIAAVLFSSVLLNSCIPFLPFGTFFADDEEEEDESPVLECVSASCDKSDFTQSEFCTLTITGALDKKYKNTRFDIDLYTQEKYSQKQTFTYNDGQAELWIKTSGISEKLSSDDQKSIDRTIKIKPASTGSFYIDFECSANSPEDEYASYSARFKITVTE